MTQGIYRNPTLKRYDRIAFFFDLFEFPAEYLRFAGWRERIFSKLPGGERILEIGIGTGKNLPYYPGDAHITGIDISTRMLQRAKAKVSRQKLDIKLIEMDVQHLDFPDNSFDRVLATFVFCSVPDPVQGLKELHRVCKPDGRLLLLEHMRPGNSIMGGIFDLLNPLVVRIIGANINRRTMDNIRLAGWNILFEDQLYYDIVRLIEAEP